MTSFAGGRRMTVIRATSIRFILATLALGLSYIACIPSCRGQSVPAPAAQAPPQKPSAAIPATSPTSSSAPHADTTSVAPAQRLDVQLADGKVSVDASNANLNQVLHEVASKAGIKVTGDVNDDRVFGHYGPSSASAILAMLLDGTGTNMLLVDDANGASELILTPRRGSPTPPNPNAAQDASSDEQTTAPRYVPPIRPFQPYQAGRPQGQIPPPTQPEANQSGSDPNSTRQIYDQLQKNAQQSTSQDGTTQQQPPQQ
jgi:hypothetical protein